MNLTNFLSAFGNRIRCSQLLDHFKDSLVKLSVKPAHLKDFAHQVQVVNGMKEDEKSIFKATSQVYSLHYPDNTHYTH